MLKSTCKYIKNIAPDELWALAVVLCAFLSIYASGAAVLALIIRLIRTGRLVKTVASIRYAALMLCVALIGFISSVAHENRMGLIYSLAMAAILTAAFYMRSIMTRDLLKKLLVVICAGSVLSFLIALGQYIGSADPEYRVSALFMNANYYASSTEIAVLCAIYLLMKRPGRKQKLLLAGVIACNLCGLYMTDCRTAIVVLAVAVPAMLIVGRERRAALAVLITELAALCFIIAVPEIFPRADEMNSDMLKRLSIWAASIKAIKAEPLLGYGPSGYGIIYGLYAGHPAPHAHSIVFDALVNFGICGAAGIGVYFLSSMRSLIQLTHTDTAAAAFGTAAIGCLLLHGLLDVTFFWIQTSVLMAVPFACAGMPNAEYARYSSRLLQQQTVRKRY